MAMTKDKILSTTFVILGLLVIVGSAYYIAAYASDMLRAIVDFVTTTDYTKLRQCGVSPPEQFDRAKADLTTLILPFLYAGLPVLFLLVSFLMFVGGIYYNKAQQAEEAAKRDQIKQELTNKFAGRTDAKRNATPTSVVKPAQPSTQKPHEETPPTDGDEEEN